MVVRVSIRVYMKNSYSFTITTVKMHLFELSQADKISEPETRVYFSKGFWCAEQESDLRIAPSPLVSEISQAKRTKIEVFANI